MSFWTAVANFFKDAKIAWETADALQKISYVFTAVTAVTGVKGFLQARNMQNKGQDILANKTAAGGKLPVIYGTRRVGAQIIYMDVSANDSRDLYVVYALSVGECDEILGRTIELDGNPLTDSARFRDGGYIGSDKISSGNYSLNTVSQNGTGINAGAGQFGSSPTSKYRYVMNLHHGQATQIADPMLVASMPNWTTAHKLNGVAYIAAHYGYDKEGIWSGVPQLTVQVRGKKVFDPRDTNQTFGTVSTYKYSDNPALTFLDYITNNEYGKGLTQSQINMSTFTAAANVCDTKVDQPYFNGTAQSLTWSGNIGDDFITIGGTDPNTNWWQNKVGEIIDVRDGSNTLVVDGKEIKDVQRNGFYDQNNEYIVYINDTLGSTYSSQAGTSLVKVKRFHCNGYLDANKNVMDNAKELLANMRGIFLYIDGKYELSIEDTGTATFNITDDHIISDAGISVDYGNKDKKANKVIVEFFNANKKYELDTATVLHDATPEYYSDDGDEILEIKAEFPYVTDPYIAYNMAKAILVRSRKQMTIQFLGTPEMYKLNVGDIVTLSYAGTFDTVQTCRVEALELQSNGLVSVSLIEYFDVYTWETPPEEPLEELANLPSAYAVKAPTGLSFTDSNASSTDRPFLSWNTPTDFPDAQYRVNVVDGSGNQVINRIVDVENCDLNFVPTGSYVASVTSLNTLGTESSPARFPTTGTFTVGDAPVGLGDVQADVITANEINVTSLSAISADLGSITAGNMNIGSGNFTVSTAGLMTATDATISGGITATSLNVTNATITGTLDASVITLNNEPLSNVLTYSEVGGIGLLSFNEGAAIDGDFVVAGNFEATGSQPDLIVGKVTGISSDTVQANAILRSLTGSGSFKIQGGQSNTTVVSLAYDALGGTTLSADGGAVGTFKINADGALALTFDSSQNATFTGEVTADALGLPSQTPSTTTNKLYNVGGSLYFNGSAIGGGGASTTINNNADNRIITGSGTANTLNAESGLTYDGSTLSGANIQMTGNINASGVTANNVSGNVLKINSTTVVDSSRNLTNIGTISSGATTTTSDTFNKIYSITDQANAGIEFSSHSPSRGQKGNIFFQHGNTLSYGTGAAFTINSTETLTVLADGRLMFKDGLYVKPSSGTGAGTQIIDSSRNLLNIGTISSGANSGIIKEIGGDISLVQGAVGLRINDSASAISATTATSNNDASVDLGVSNIRFRNLFLSGTISSGAITSTGTSQFDRVKTGLGTVGSPAVQVGDTDSGFFDSGANEIGVSLAGVLEYEFIATQFDMKSNNLTGVGTISNSGVIRQTISNVGIPTVYGSFTMEAADAHLDLVSSSAGTWGSAINFVEGASTSANTNNWSIARKTSGGGNSLNFNFGTANQHDNTTRVSFSSAGAISSGAITATGAINSTGTGRAIQVNGTTRINSVGDIIATSYYIGGTNIIDTSRNLTSIGTISQVGAVSLNSNSLSDPDSISRTNYPAGQMLTHYGEANGVSIIGGQGGYTGCGLTIGEETDHSANFKFIRGISDTNGTPSERFSINGVGDINTMGTLSAGFTHLYKTGSGQTIVAVIGSDSLRPVLQFSESTATTINAGMSLEYNGQGSGATNYMSINAVTGASIFKVYSGGNVQLTGAAKLLFNNTSNFGVGAGGHNYNSVYVDTLESGSANDMLELVYYQGSGVRIGQSGNEKPLICGAFTSEAITTDGNFVMTKDQPWVVIENTAEDGGGIVFNDNQAGAWPAASSQQFRMTYNSGNNSFVMGHDENSYTGFSFASGGNFTANGNVTAYSDERLKTNIETLDSKKALQMRGVSFIKDGVEGSGVIAQEIEEIAPELVLTADDEMGTKSVAYGNLVGYLIETVKDQQKQIDELKQRLDNDS